MTEKFAWKWSWLPGVIGAWLALVALRLLTFGTGENDVDCFFHVAIVQQGWNVFAAPAFPTLTMSVWTTSFSDRELLYHLFLRGLLELQNGGGPAVFPFHFPALVFAGLLPLALAVTLGRLHARWLWLWPLLLVALDPEYTCRVLMLRPYVMAMSILILSCAALAWCDRPRRCGLLFLCGFVMAWSYSNPHFILLPAAGFAVAVWPRDRKLAVLLPVTALLGVLVGLTLHPQFPNTLLNWKTQCVDVLLARYNAPYLGFGDELYMGGWRNWLRHPGLLALGAVNLTLALALWRRGEQRDRELRLALLLPALATLVGMLLFGRLVEYAAPFNVLASALLFTAGLRQDDRSIKRVVRTGFLVLLAATGFYTVWCFAHAAVGTQHPDDDFAVWARRAGIPPGTVIANVNWSDFPALYYSAPEYRYLHGIEPMFGYAALPDRIRKLELFRTGRMKLTPAQLREVTGSELVFVSAAGWELARDMARTGYKIVYQGRDGWVFRLPPETIPNHG